MKSSRSGFYPLAADAKAPISPPLDLERLKPMKMERVAIARRLGETQARQPGEQDRQRDGNSSRASGAPTQKWMPAPKLRRADRRARVVEDVGAWKALGIAVGGAEQQAELLALS